MRINLGVACTMIAIVAAATGCGGYSAPNDSDNSPAADSAQDTTSTPPPPSPYLQR